MTIDSVQDVIVVGAGLAGLLTTCELLAGGASVTLLERGESASESSWAGGGILSPLYPWRYPDEVSLLSQWGQSFYPSFCETLFQETGIDPQYTKSGLLMLDTDDQQTVMDWKTKFATHVQLIDKKKVQALELSLSEAPDSAYWMPDVAQVRNPRLLRALKAFVEGKGARIINFCNVEGFIQSRNKLRGVKSTRGDLYANKVVLTAGAWSGQILKKAGFKSPPIEPVRGQMLLFKTEPGQIKRITLSDEHYVIPRQDGRVLVGSTMEYVGFEKITTKQAFKELRAVAMRLFPILEKAKIEQHWAGLRPGSTHGIPYIGAAQDVSGLYVNAGHFRNGVVLGPASARKIAKITLDCKQKDHLNYT